MARLVRILALLPTFLVPAFSQAPIRGFPPDQWKAEHDREEEAKAIPQPARIGIYMERMASKPHHAGSPGSKAVADYAAGQLKEWGLDVRVETFQALLPYPTVRLLEMTAPTRFRASLKEPAVPEDKDTSEAGQLPPYNAYSASGDVTAPLVYVNFGNVEDYDYLKAVGIDVKGKIVIARYGKGWRGLKPRLAQEHGAIGCLIYSDPREDGYFQNDVYPAGPMRPSAGVQRGSVMDMAVYPGDPLSPGTPSEPGASLLPRADAKTIMKIPVMPISYGDAKPLLEALGGRLAPEAWRGALPITYHIGAPGPAVVHLKLDFDWTSKPLNDIIVTIPGSVYKDQWIVYGNHHDAWVNGASDPGSGASALLETARTLATLRKEGWQPKRTIVLALWDAEEFGLVGSTEWVEKHEEELERKAAVYINSDSSGSGKLQASGSHTLERFVRQVLRDVPSPEGGQNLLDSLRNAAGDEVQPNATDVAEGDPLRTRPPAAFHLGALGSGSDYVPFLDHAGVASLNFGFGGDDSIGVYHSAYDTVRWYEQFSDKDFSHGRALAQLTTTMLLRLSDAAVLPFEFRTLARTVRSYADDIQGMAQKSGGMVDFQQVRAALTRIVNASTSYEDSLSALMGRGSVAPERLLKVNEMLARMERALLLPDGLPERGWFRHQVYAPGLYTGYDAKTLPAVREAVEAKRWADANQQARRAAQSLEAIGAQIEDAARMLKNPDAPDRAN
jgi:N-acetylated-alpha-linked acidic dipeptidase